MATFTKIQDFTEQLIRGIHDWDNHTFKLMLSSVAPISTNTVKSDLTEIDAGGGYTAGGLATTITLSEVGGLTTVQGAQTMFAASNGTIGPFRYVALYNDTSSSKNLICFWDYGSNIQLNDGETFTVKFNGSNPGTIFTLA